jgi:transcriptional regulator with XRE-family HTH domain
MNKEQVQTTLGSRIRRARKQRGMTQATIAARVGMSRSQIVNIEAGRSDTPVWTLCRIAAALGVAPHLLLDPGDFLEAAND